MRLRHEQSLVLGERLLDLGVLRQDREVGDAEPLRGLALREAVVLVAVLDHEPRGLPRDGLPHHVAAYRSLWHQNIGSSYFCGGASPSAVLSPDTPGGR